MPIKKIDFGVHKDVTLVQFGSGDVLMSIGRYVDMKTENHIMLSQHFPHPIGTRHPEFVGRVSDEVPEIKVVLEFENVESLESLIGMLEELKEKFIVEPVHG